MKKIMALLLMSIVLGSSGSSMHAQQKVDNTEFAMQALKPQNALANISANRVVVRVPDCAAATTLPHFLQTKTETKMNSNRELVKSHFQRWATGSGSFFDLLDDQVQWTISGSSTLSKTYTSKKQLLDEVIDPLNKRLSKLIVPTVRSIFEDGNTIIAIWDGAATAVDGRPYNVSYAWFMEMKARKIIKVTAFLDTKDLQEIFTRIKT